MVRNVITLLASATLVIGCANKDDGDAATNPSGEEGSTGGPSTFDPNATSTSGNDPDGSTSNGEPETSGGSNSFIETPDGGTVTVECDVWAQDCPAGEKCMPWSNDGTAWNATKCTPLDPNPAQVGDECTVEGSGTSGVDNCALASMCWGVDPETNTGTCVSFCTGSEANPSCDNPSTTCSITNGGSLILCLPTCDPLAQTCVEGQGCYGWGETFLCMGGHGHAAPGEPCEFVNACEPGSYCASAADLSGCQGASGCCAPFCDVNAVDPCPGAAEGVECVPWFHEGQVHPSLENVGGCVGPW